MKLKVADLSIEEDGVASGLAEVVRSRTRALGVELIAVRSAGHSDRSSVFKNAVAERGEIRASTFRLSKAIPEDARLRGTVPLPSRQATQQGASMAELAASSAD
jgi:hypothetical protein